MNAIEQVVEWAEQIETSDLSQHEKKVLSFAENHCKVRADLVQAAGVILRMIQEIDSAEQFNEMFPVAEIRSCGIVPCCTVIVFNNGTIFHSFMMRPPLDLDEVPSLRSE